MKSSLRDLSDLPSFAPFESNLESTKSASAKPPYFARFESNLKTSPTSKIQQIFVTNVDAFSSCSKEYRQMFAIFVAMCAETLLILDHQDQLASKFHRLR